MTFDVLLAETVRAAVAEAVEPLRRELVELRRAQEGGAMTIAEAARRRWRSGSVRLEPSGVWSIRWPSKTGGRRFRSGFKTREDAVAAVERIARLKFQPATPMPMSGEAPWSAACEGCGWRPPNIPGCRGIMHSHHIVPRSRGGSDEAENLAVLCPTCHSIAHRTLYPKGQVWNWPTSRAPLIAGLREMYGMAA